MDEQKTKSSSREELRENESAPKPRAALTPDSPAWEDLSFGPCFRCQDDCKACGCNHF